MKIRQTTTFYERLSMSQRVQERHPGMVPIYIEASDNKHIPSLQKSKYLIPQHYTIGQLIHTLRKNLQLKASDGIFLFVCQYIKDGLEEKETSVSVPTSLMLSVAYQQYHDEDGFLYMKYAKESVFG